MLSLCYASTANEGGLAHRSCRSRAFRQPVLTFEDDNMAERLAVLREREFKLSDEMPDALDERESGVLIAPEGTRLLLMPARD